METIKFILAVLAVVYALRTLSGKGEVIKWDFRQRRPLG